ncbi:hypothetical protein B0H10DRAFT_2094650 [Mycena sp. CBHHK59/15]|nr:hypothetical protein B0H10DRAFT_2094650 [Mycena sp. CBHHK59/15]
MALRRARERLLTLCSAPALATQYSGPNSRRIEPSARTPLPSRRPRQVREPRLTGLRSPHRLPYATSRPTRVASAEDRRVTY